MVGAAMGFELLMATALAIPMALPGCPERCGDVLVPFPFGIGHGCFHEGFNLTCDATHSPPKLFMDDGVEVLDFSLPDGTLRIRSSLLQSFSSEFNGSWFAPSSSTTEIFKLAAARNSFVAYGCNMLVQLVPRRTPGDLSYASICASVCPTMNWGEEFGVSSCSGVACCRTSITPFAGDLPSYDIQVKQLIQQRTHNYLSYGTGTAAFIVDQDWFIRNEAEILPHFRVTGNRGEMVKNLSVHNLGIPAVLEWSLDLIRDEGLFLLAPIGPGSSDFRCLSSNSFSFSTDGTYDRRRCNSQGYEGNPYINDGCQGVITGIAISAGFGLLFSLLGVAKITRKLKHQRAMKLRQKFFRRNHGLLLQQLISSNKDIAERLKIFSLEELEQATNKFDQNRILGGGGHGTVYKGILADQRVVAIKKSKIVVQREINEFINEVVILSQTNHRNVVKLFGCCLETEVPLLVYEFISNGTLTYHLHGQSENPLSWKDRLRIALEIARAIAYLHSAASISVFHRDIKCANILLTDALTVKVSDFGASRSISIDETGILTAIQGTHGYLDPEYYYTSRLTEKSDVYSFGVILAELLTRIKPVFPSHSSEVTSLASYFMSEIRENHLLDILDQQIVEEGGTEVAEVVARLAEACLRLKGEERPTMRQVETRLEDAQRSKVNSQINRTDQISSNVQLYTRSKGGEGTRQYSLEKEFIHSSEIPR
ncbi:hypothetical protein PR202_gb14122 [Eleusine coracana subsp. coracana]|uniref:Protein kinase domain-containing protein n=1 Tax=Eleusine coracana subsp. coracana TaxID=191504 RepID=A0AAV5EUN6_ELECO|nr:hypothetical protein PR202_gb14122 [Eleusine coracana subsp. coracana]